MPRYNLKEWLTSQPEIFKKEVGADGKMYMKRICTLEELKELDRKFINNPEGDNDGRASGYSKQ